MQAMFRKMVKADIAQLLVIEQSVQGAPWTEETFKTCFEMAYDGWIVERDTQIAGYMMLAMQTEECHVLRDSGGSSWSLGSTKQENVK
jgi:hypothetical protein